MLTPEAIRSDTLRSFLTVYTGLQPKTLSINELKESDSIIFDGNINSGQTTIINIPSKNVKQRWYSDYELSDYLKNYFRPAYNIFTSKNAVFRLYYNRLLVVADDATLNDYAIDLNELLHHHHICYTKTAATSSRKFTTIEDVNKSLEIAVNIKYDNILKELVKLSLETVNEYANGLPDNELSKLTKEYEELQQSIDKLTTQLIDKKRELKRHAADILYRKTEPSEHPFKRFINFANRCKTIKSIQYNINNCEYPSVYLFTDWFPIDYTYEDERADKLIMENATFKNNNEKEILLDAITKRERYKIMHRPVFINIIESENQLLYNITALDFSIHKYYDINLRNKYRNVHFFDFDCLGSFKSDLNLAKTDKDYIRLTTLLLQYLQTINIADYAGTTWLSSEHMIYDSLENKYFIYNPKDGSKHYINKDDICVTTPAKTNIIIDKEYLE